LRRLGRGARRAEGRGPGGRHGGRGAEVSGMGISGRIARAFLRSKLTPLVTLASLAVGLFAVVATPREEEPQISVPMIDVIAALPGAGPEETENLLARPIEKLMWEVPGVDYVYATGGDGFALVTV